MGADPEKGKQDTATAETPLLGSKHAKAKEIKERAKINKKVIALCASVAAILSVGCVLGVMSEGWHPITALYVVVQIATTVGYGDFTVQTNAMKVIMCIYVLVCLVVLAYAMNLVTQGLLDVQNKVLRKKLRQFEAEVHGGESGAIKDPTNMNALIVATGLFLSSVLVGTLFYSWYESCTCSYGVSLVEGCVETTYEKCVATGGYVKDIPDSIYMSVITMTTVGFGDHTPRTKIGRVFGCFWMMVGCAFTANWLGALTKVIFEMEASQEEDKEQDQMVSREVFDEMDKSKNGKLSRAEFRAFLLVKHGIISQEDLNLLDQQFDKLDRDKTGELSFEECNGQHITGVSHVR